MTLTPESLKSHRGRLLVKAEASWCNPCRLMAAYTGRVAAEMAISFIPIDADTEMPMLRALSVSALPTLILFEDGVEVKRKVGFMPESRLREFLA